MTFESDKMLLAHAQWKSRLKSALEGGEQIDIASSERDDLCELGKWLNAEGRNYRHLPSYQDLKEKHTKFHASVGQVLRKARTCVPRDFPGLLHSTASDFGRASSACINAIASLRQAIAKN